MKNIKDKLIGIDNKIRIKLTKTTRLLLYVVGVGLPPVDSDAD